MALLRNLEQSLSGLVEGTIGRVFRTEVRPTEIARKLAREMEINKRVSLSRTYAPTDYLVYLSPDDRGRYAGVEDSIAEELGAYLLEHARRERLVLVRRPLVEFVTDKRLRLGEFGIEARTAPVSAEEAPPRPDPQAPAAAPRDRDSRSRAGNEPRAAAPDPSPVGSRAPASGYEPPAPVGAFDDAPYEDPYAGDPFGGGAPAVEPGYDDGDAYAWEDEPPARQPDPEPAHGAQPEYEAAGDVGGHGEDWLDPVDDWEPEAAAPQAPPAPEPPRPAPERPQAPRTPEPAPGAMPWIDPTLQRQSRPQFAPPVVPSRQPRERQTTILVDGTPHDLSGERVVLGRSRTADIVISDPSVSRQHCELRRDDRGSWYALDLGSTNGSELDGTSLDQPKRLEPGQRLKLGHAPAIIEVR